MPPSERLTLGKEPSEKGPAATFWAKVRKALAVHVEEEGGIPCECAH